MIPLEIKGQKDLKKIKKIFRDFILENQVGSEISQSFQEGKEGTGKEGRKLLEES